VILEGAETPAARDALFSTVHGAGRRLSRTQAAGRRRRRWSCTNRSCGWVQPPRSSKPARCPDCRNTRLVRRWVQDQPGLIDFERVQADLRAQGIELRGGAADEAPAAYKRLDEVLAQHGESVRVLHRLTPIGVAMAGGDIFDPYKD
jgi:tRNA-splicing ligase RtcB